MFCHHCDDSLAGHRYVLRDDHPYCIKCYENVFANNCDECGKIIGIDSKVSHHYFQSRNDNKNDNGDLENSSGLSSLLSKFSLTKLRSQKWAKPVSRLSLLISMFSEHLFIFLIQVFQTFITQSTLSDNIRVLKVTSGLADAAGWFYQTPCHLVTM